MVQPMRGQSPKMLFARSDRDKDYATFCSISLSSEPRGSRSLNEHVAALQHLNASMNTHRSPQQLSTFEQHQQLVGRRQQHKRLAASRRRRSRYCAAVSACCRRVADIPLAVVVVTLLFCLGVCGVVMTAILIARAAVTTDDVLFLGALVSAAFSLVVVVSYSRRATVRSHPNPLIFSKSVVDLLLAALYIFEYVATEFAAPPIALPFRLAALTQALLVSGECWFVAIPIDLVQSITNPFTSYARNVRRYWVYSTLSGAVCGLLLYCLDDSAGDSRPDSVDSQRFFWFHHNTDTPGFFAHRWVLYHVWVLAYALFSVACIQFVRRRLRRGLAETFDVRRRSLASGIATCAIYISWSFALLALFALTNVAPTKRALGARAFALLVRVSAFAHAARGGVNVIVWLVVNAPVLTSLCAGRGSGPATSMQQRAVESFSSSDLAASSPTSLASTQPNDVNPQLNRALRRQIVHMATSGIIESVEQFHARSQRFASNQTFALDWTRSSQREMLATQQQTRLQRRSTVVQVVDTRGNGAAAAPTRFALFLPLAMKEMQFYDFQPRVFASIRALYGIDDVAYQYAFRSTVNERISEGRSGAFVFQTCDRRYVVKSMTPDDKNVLLSLLPSYLRYLKWNPRTLLPRFLGFHAMKMYGQVFYVVVMGNVLSTSEPIHRRYDIKGSWVDRNAPACVLGERYRCSKCNRFFTFGANEPCDALGADHYPDITLRDNDLKKRLKLAPETATQLLKQLTRDSNFLASMGIMDYSLLVGAHYSHFRITARRRPADDAGVATQMTDVEATAAPTTAAQPHELKLERTAASISTAAARDRAFVHALADAPSDNSSSGSDSSDSDSSSSEGEAEEVGEPPATAPALIYAAASSAHSESHCYRAQQVSGPSAYYFGLVDILQLWTLGKQVERAYKVHVLRKDERGVSAMAPKPYALRFQQKMHQLFSGSQTPALAHHVVLERQDGERSDSLADLIV